MIKEIKTSRIKDLSGQVQRLERLTWKDRLLIPTLDFTESGWRLNQ